MCQMLKETKILAAFASCRLKSVHCAIRLLLHVAEGCSCQEHPIQSSSSEFHKSCFNGARLLFLWRALRSRVSCRVVGRRLYLCLCLCLPLSLSLIDIHGFRFSRCFGRSLSLRTSSHQPLNLPLHRFFSTLLTGILQLSQHPQM